MAGVMNASINYPINSTVGGGETGIRTLGRLAPTTVFETAPFDHSGTSPCLFHVEPPRVYAKDALWYNRKLCQNLSISWL